MRVLALPGLQTPALAIGTAPLDHHQSRVMRSLERVRTRGSRNRDSRVWSASLDARSPCQVGRSAYREPAVDVGVIRGDPLGGELLGISAPESRVGNPAAATATYQAALLRGHGEKDKGGMVRVFEELLEVEYRSRAERQHAS
jgi:hypothetical protein